MNKDILKAIDIENVYLEYKLSNATPPYQLVDEIKRYGFESLEEYFDNKKEYEFSKLTFTIKNIPSSECLTEGLRMLDEKDVGIFFSDTEDIIVYSCNSKPCNKKYCQENNIIVYDNLPVGGGAIVSNKGDFVLGLCIPDNLNISSHFILNKIAYILDKYMDNVEVIDNDILVNGGKVCGMTYLRNNGMIIYLAHFSFSDKSKLIESICHDGIDNGAVKRPSYISNMDKDILKMEVMKCLHFI